MSMAMETDVLVQHIWEGIFGPSPSRHSCDIEKTAKLISAIETTQYYLRHMQRATLFEKWTHLYQDAIRRRPSRGLVLEFGVASGKTLRVLASAVAGKVYGFDSFEGLPENWLKNRGQGLFKQDKPPELPDNAELVIGLFRQTLPDFVKQNPEPVSLLHIDCDLYSSTRDILYFLGPHIGPGSVIIFNEYFNYPGWQHHEHKAFQEFVAANDVKYDYIGVTRAHQQVSAIIHFNRNFAFGESAV